MISIFDKGLRTLFGPSPSTRPTPGQTLQEVELTEEQKRHVIGLMRVNHCGEICAQALYQSQAFAATKPELKRLLQQAADEEGDHLAWSAQRISELGGRISILNPLWYSSSFVLGLIAGKAGDNWNLGFLAETERQVEQHLKEHLKLLPSKDHRTHAILEQMKQDEARHAVTAIENGAQILPIAVRYAMKFASKIMTKTSYRI